MSSLSSPVHTATVPHLLLNNLNIGAAIINVGRRLRYLDTGELLPESITGGVSYSTIIEDINTTLAIDNVYDINNKEDSVLAGLEGVYKDLSVRIGVPFMSSSDTTLTTGLGYKMGQFQLDYAVVFGRTLAVTHRFSISIR